MRGLGQFETFDWMAFAKDKRFVVTSVSDFIDHETKEHLGTKVECVIADDKTPYEFRNGKAFTNRYEKITFKVNKDVKFPLEAHVIPKGVKAKVYGEYRNMLSVTCDDMISAALSASASTPTQLKKEG